MSTCESHLQRPISSRRLAVPCAVALFAVTTVHILDGPASLSDVPYIGVLELALAAVCVPVAVTLLVSPSRQLWIAAATVTVIALGFYLASRVVGLPGSTDDIGNWSQTLGAVNVLAELAVLATAAKALKHR